MEGVERRSRGSGQQSGGAAGKRGRGRSTRAQDDEHRGQRRDRKRRYRDKADQRIAADQAACSRTTPGSASSSMATARTARPASGSRRRPGWRGRTGRAQRDAEAEGQPQRQQDQADLEIEAPGPSAGTMSARTPRSRRTGQARPGLRAASAAASAFGSGFRRPCGRRPALRSDFRSSCAGLFDRLRPAP